MARGRAEKRPQPNLLFVAFGGGINSTAVLVGMKERGIRPDVILFADTGGEKPETYQHVAVMDQWVRTFLGTEIHTVKKNSMYLSLEDECLRRNSLPSLAYGWRSCSDKWKQEPQRKFLNHHPMAKDVWKAGEKVTRAIGFSAEETRRVKESTESKYFNWFPLIEWNWDREACIAACERENLTPPKSACYFCPASTKPDVLKLKEEHPNLYARAVAMERNADLITIKGLGRRWSWEDLAGAPEEHCIEQTCVCFDGE